MLNPMPTQVFLSIHIVCAIMLLVCAYKHISLLQSSSVSKLG